MDFNTEIDSNNEMDINEERAEEIIKKYGIIPKAENRDELRILLENEINNYRDGSSEYLRVLCGMLFCIGNIEDSVLIWRAKTINFDVGCMVDTDFIFGAGVKKTFEYIKGKKELEEMVEFLGGDNFERDDFEEELEKQKVVKEFENYYKNYFSL